MTPAVAPSDRNTQYIHRGSSPESSRGPASYPERFVRGATKPFTFPAQAWINPRRKKRRARMAQEPFSRGHPYLGYPPFQPRWIRSRCRRRRGRRARNADHAHRELWLHESAAPPVLRISADCGDVFPFRSLETSVHKLSGHNRTPFLYPTLERSKLTVTKPTGVVDPETFEQGLRRGVGLLLQPEQDF